MRLLTKLVSAGVLFALPFVALTTHADPKERTWGEEEQAEVESRILWSAELTSRVHGLSVGPDNLVVADVFGGKRYLIDGSNGAVVWEGVTTTTSPIAGNPHPVIVEVGEDSYAIRAVSSPKQTMWSKSFSDKFMIGNAYPTHGLLLVVSVDRLDAEAAKPKVRALSLNSGKVVWTIDLDSTPSGSHLSDWSVGFGPSLARKTLPLLVNDGVFGLSLDKGGVVWRHGMEFDRSVWQDRASWRVLDDDVVLASRCRVMRISPEKGVVWSKQLGPDCNQVHGVDIDASVVAVAFFVKGGRADDALVVLDAASGKENWRKAIKGDGRYGITHGVVLTENRVFVVEASKKHYLNAFNRSNGELLFKEKAIHPGVWNYTRMWQATDHAVVLFTYFKQTFRAHSTSDGSALWERSFVTLEQRVAAQSAFASSMTASTLATHTSLTLNAAQSLMEFPSLMAESFRLDPVSTATPAADNHAYLMTTQKRDASKPVVSDLNLRTGEVRTHRIPRAPKKCLAIMVANEAQGYVLETFGGDWRCPGPWRIDAIRIPSN